MELSIKNVERGDLGQIVELVREFAAFEKLSEFCQITEGRLESAMFGSDAVVEGLIALDGERAIGYALFFPNFSSFRGHRGFYIDDIYINVDYRGKGIGERMLKQIARMAKKRGFERIDFLVLEWNTPAVKFYEKLGALRDPDERHFKFTDEAFLRLQAEPPA